MNYHKYIWLLNIELYIYIYIFEWDIFLFELWFDIYDFGQSDYVLTQYSVNKDYSLVLWYPTNGSYSLVPKLVLSWISWAYRVYGPS